MIRSFADKTVQAIQGAKAPKRLPSEIVRSAQRKLFMIDNAMELKDLATPPGNRLEALRGDGAGQHSIRINDQWRICFRWTRAGAEDVEITDYH